mgnify:CR=1 FL=1
MILFPVLIGPTFTPVWEAFKMKKPVIFSNLEGAKEVYGDAVFYINPFYTSDEPLVYVIGSLCFSNIRQDPDKKSLSSEDPHIDHSDNYFDS